MQILKLTVLFHVHFLVFNECFGDKDGSSSGISTPKTATSSHSLELDSLEHELEGKYLPSFTKAQPILYNVILYRRRPNCIKKHINRRSNNIPSFETRLCRN